MPEFPLHANVNLGGIRGLEVRSISCVPLASRNSQGIANIAAVRRHPARSSGCLLILCLEGGEGRSGLIHSLAIAESLDGGAVVVVDHSSSARQREGVYSKLLAEVRRGVETALR